MGHDRIIMTIIYHMYYRVLMEVGFFVCRVLVFFPFFFLVVRSTSAMLNKGTTGTFCDE